MRDHSALIAHIQNDLWALDPRVLDRAVSVFSRQVNDLKLTDDQIDEIVAARDPDRGREKTYEVMNSTAIIPVTGVIAKLASSVNRTSQAKGTATQTVSRDLARAMADPDVERIMLLVDSPGGSVAGVADLAGEIRQAAERKPLTAFIEDTGASAAYWLASQAAKVYSNASAAVGSIGVYAVVADSSQMAEKMGLKFHVIKAGDLKGAGTPGTEVTDEQITAWQERIDDVYGLFTGDVAAGRGMKIEKVQAVADGRVFTGAKAKKAGLVDAITDFRGALKRTARVSVGDGPRRARAETQEPIMADEQEKTAAELAAASAEASAQEQTITQADVEQATADAVAADRQRTTDIMAAVGQFPEVAEKAIADGLTVEAAKAQAFDRAVDQRDEALERLAAIKDAGVEPAAVDNGAEAAEGLTPAQAAEAGIDDGKAETYQARLDLLMKPNANGDTATAAQAHKIAAKELPKSFAAWNEAGQPGSKD